MSDFEGGVVEGGTGVEGQEGGVGGNQHAQPNPLEPGGARFEQVYGRMKEYESKANQFKEFGDPAQVRERLQKLESYEKALEDYRKKQSMTPSEQQQAQRTLQLQKELYQVMPSLKLLDKIEQLEATLNEYAGKSTEAQYTATLKDMSLQLSDVLKANKIDTRYQDKIEDYIASQMTDAQQREFIAGNFEIAKQIFENEMKEGLFASLKAKPSLPTPALRNTPGGTPPQGKEKKPMSMKEAEDAAWSRLTGGE